MLAIISGRPRAHPPAASRPPPAARLKMLAIISERLRAHPPAVSRPPAARPQPAAFSILKMTKSAASPGWGSKKLANLYGDSAHFDICHTKLLPQKIFPAPDRYMTKLRQKGVRWIYVGRKSGLADRRLDSLRILRRGLSLSFILA